MIFYSALNFVYILKGIEALVFDIMLTMNTEIAKAIMTSPYPKIAAEVRWNDEQRYGSKTGLQRRLAEMTTAGIVSEVLDVIEALEMSPDEATPALITTYETSARSAESLVAGFREKGRPDLVEESEKIAQRDRAHAIALRDGITTIAQELEARVQKREELGIPNNFYKTLLANPVFPH